MTMETTPAAQDQSAAQRKAYRSAASASAPVYGLGLIGAWIYFFTHASSLWDGILGFFQGIFWPAVLVYESLKFLHL